MFLNRKERWRVGEERGITTGIMISLWLISCVRGDTPLRHALVVFVDHRRHAP